MFLSFVCLACAIVRFRWSIAPGVARLGMNPYNWRSNCVHGWTNGPTPWPTGTCWTVFPNPMAVGATFDPKHALTAGQITSTEGRALHNIALAKYNGSSPEASGLNCFSPNVVSAARVQSPVICFPSSVYP